MNELGKKAVPRVADIVAQTLHAHGVRHAFGVPGGEVVTLLDALEKAGIPFHLARHETAAAIMAAGASAVTDKPELLVTTVGPGLANAVNGIADAAQERMPLIVISGVVDRETRERYTHQVISHRELLRPLVKASFEVEPESASSTVARALALATTDPQGPVHLDLSPAVAAREAVRNIVVEPARLAQLAAGTTDPVVTALAARLNKAKRPVIIAGFEAARSKAGEKLLHLAEALEAPVVTTYKAKGILREDHPLCLGGAGLSPRADAVLLPLIKNADLVLTVGYDPIEMRLGWLDFVEDPDKLVELSATPIDHGMHHAGHRIHAPIASVLAALVPAVDQRKTWPGDTVSATKARLDDFFSGSDEWGPHRIFSVLEEAAGKDAIVTVDSGAHRILLSQRWKARHPLQLLQSAGFCTMAAALPLAIGAKVADPGRRVFAVMGDGGLEMGIGELATLRDLGVPITILVLQDRSLALIAQKQAAAGLPACGVELGETDFATVAAGFGGAGINVETLDDLREALSAAAARASFSLVCCRFAASAYDGAF